MKEALNRFRKIELDRLLEKRISNLQMYFSGIRFTFKDSYLICLNEYPEFFITRVFSIINKIGIKWQRLTLQREISH